MGGNTTSQRMHERGARKKYFGQKESTERLRGEGGGVWVRNGSWKKSAGGRNAGANACKKRAFDKGEGESKCTAGEGRGQQGEISGGGEETASRKGNGKRITEKEKWHTPLPNKSFWIKGGGGDQVGIPLVWKVGAAGSFWEEKKVQTSAGGGAAFTVSTMGKNASEVGFPWSESGRPLKKRDVSA